MYKNVQKEKELIGKGFIRKDWSDKDLNYKNFITKEQIGKLKIVYKIQFDYLRK